MAASTYLPDSLAWIVSQRYDAAFIIPDNVLVPAVFCLWEGLAIHHYLDQKIWRISKAKDLQRHLGVTA